MPAAGNSAVFVVQSNQSMSRQALLTAYAGITATTLTVALYFFALGLPLVLPFSGIEIAALGAAFYVSGWRTGPQQVITIDANAVAVETGREAPEVRNEFQRQWAKVVLERPHIGWYPSRLYIRSHGRQVEVGRFLNEQERQGLAGLLAAEISAAPKTT